MLTITGCGYLRHQLYAGWYYNGSWFVFVAAFQGYDAFRDIKNYHSKTFIM